MRVVLFGNASEKIAAIRYRVIKFAEMLGAEGHECIVCLPASVEFRERWWENGNKLQKLVYHGQVLLRRLWQLRVVRGADVVVFRGPLFDYGPPVLERICRKLNPNLVFDIDDAIWEPPAHVKSRFVGLVDYGWTKKMAQMSRHAIVGNRYLAEYVSACTVPPCPADDVPQTREGVPVLADQNAVPHVSTPEYARISIVPTCIDMERHTPKVFYAHSWPVVLGWTGLKDNLGYIDMIAPVLQALAKEYDIVLDVATGRPYELEGVKVVNHYWEINKEIEYLQCVDIGLMPLQDTPRARGKCAFKALQYMAVGVPVVISPVGLNAEVIEDGVEGFLASTPEEWYDRLEQLISNPNLRRHMGGQARERVKREFSHEANYNTFKRAITLAAEK